MTALLNTEIVTEAEMVQRARDLKPALRERSDAACLARHMPADTIEDFRNLGFFKILQPKRWGGFEMDPRVFFDVVIEVASACPSSAWVLGVVGVHNWQLALFDEQAQIDVWGEDDNVLVSSSYMPTGKVERVEGGFKFSGRWGFSSGSDYCDWAFLGGFVPPEREGDLPEMRTFLVPKSDYTLLDDWHTSGLKATGSKTVVIDDCFVPEYRTHKMSDGFRCISPGHAQNDAAIYKLPFGQIFTRSVATPAIGMAMGAIEAYKEVTGKRVGRADGQKVSLDPQSQEVVARATLLVDEAKTMLHRDYEEIMGFARSGDKIDMETRVRWRYNSSVATTKSVEAVDLLFTTSGGGAIFLDSAINRFFQDVHAARGHYANNPHKSGRNYGGVMLGMRTTDWFI